MNKIYRSSISIPSNQSIKVNWIIVIAKFIRQLMQWKDSKYRFEVLSQLTELSEKSREGTVELVFVNQSDSNCTRTRENYYENQLRKKHAHTWILRRSLFIVNVNANRLDAFHFSTWSLRRRETWEKTWDFWNLNWALSFEIRGFGNS